MHSQHLTLTQVEQTKHVSLAGDNSKPHLLQEDRHWAGGNTLPWLMTTWGRTSGLAAGDLGEPPPGESMQVRSVRSCSIPLPPSRL